MSTLYTIFIVLAILASVLLIIVVLLQNSKGEGMASNFVAGNQAFGVRQTADILEKVTWGLVSFILVISIASAFTYGRSNGNSSVLNNEIEKAATEQPAFPSSLNNSAPAQTVPATPDQTAPANTNKAE